MSNRAIIRALDALALYADLEGERFRVRAYRDAVDTIRAQRVSLTQLAEERGEAGLVALPKIGKGIAKKIVELAKTGAIAELESARGQHPFDIVDLTSVEGVGPKQARVLFDTLGVTSRAALADAAKKGALAKVPGFRGKKGARVARSLEAGIIDRSEVVGRVYVPARTMLEALADEVELRGASFAGPLRRFDERVPCAQLLVGAEDRDAVARAFQTVEGVDVVLDGLRVEHVDGFVAELTIVPPQAFGAALLFATGSERHLESLATFAEMKGLRLDRDGVHRGTDLVAAETEEAIYAALGLPFIPPELRDGEAEFRAIMAGGLPSLIEAPDVQGDLQTQTEWSDGRDSIEAMVAKARALGYAYFAVTDHSHGLGVAGGLDPKRLAEQGDYIDALDAKLDDIELLKGSEVNILADGSLDLPDESLKNLDFVGAAIHSAFDLDRAAMTARIVKAIEHPAVDVYFHPTTRVLGRRAPIDFDFDAVLAAAKRTGTALEIDAFAPRLDLSSTLIRRALEAGVELMLDSDAHRVAQLDYSRDLGVPLARRGWARAADVVNTRPAPEFRAWLRDRRARAGW